MKKIEYKQREAPVLDGLPLQLQLWATDFCSHKRRRLLQRAKTQLVDRFPATWHEYEFPVGKWHLDKAFACTWLDSERVLLATKCNRLLEVDTRIESKREIKLPPEPTNRQHALVETGWGFCGIHSIDINSSRTLLVTGGKNPTDAVVLSLEDYKPLRTLTGHVDWVFGARWVSDRHVITGSRDGAVALWDIQEGKEYVVKKKDYKNKNEMKRKFKGRVREVKYDPQSMKAAALGTEGCVKLFDLAADLKVVQTICLKHVKELVCMEQRADLVAVGSCGHVSLADPRLRQPEVLAVPSPDAGQGVRSVALQEHLLSFGTGQGKLVFFDMRTWRLLQSGICSEESTLCDRKVLNPMVGQQQAFGTHLECGRGWLHEDTLFWDHFWDVDVRHACYAHAWDPTRTRLFACGGPLAFGLTGCYMALWR